MPPSHKKNIVRDAVIKMKEKLPEYIQGDEIDIYFCVGKKTATLMICWMLKKVMPGMSSTLLSCFNFVITFFE